MSCNLLIVTETSGIKKIILDIIRTPLTPKLSIYVKDKNIKILKICQYQNSFRDERVSKSNALLKQFKTELIKSSKIFTAIILYRKPFTKIYTPNIFILDNLFWSSFN